MDMSRDDWLESLEELEFDMQDHLQVVQYCCDQFEEFLEEEYENERENKHRVEQLLQRRLAASLASRG